MVPQYLLMRQHCCTRTNYPDAGHNKTQPQAVRELRTVAGRTAAFNQPIWITE